MASTSTFSIVVPISCASKKTQLPRSQSLFNTPLHSKALASSSSSKENIKKFQVKASMKEKVVTGVTAAALTASMMAPNVAEAASVSPSLKNFLLSIGAGGLVAVAIVGAVIGVANFDPVKRS
ncbi:uncharacterized protein [Cicer arietinum]|uniref:Uncharacterized protein LOC101505710 n=1 Tax=Cicer arietinum TaxID=3827 RepID=A0A1S2YPM1_CICAR|nr:uncharacterized protein LOC101505710 [Cicer arietinum]